MNEFNAIWELAYDAYYARSTKTIPIRNLEH